jgi:hypothetical protein
MKAKINFIDELGVRASIVVTSILSDMQHEFLYFRESEVENSVLRLDFAKWLLFQLNGNLNEYIDVKLATECFYEFKGIKAV